MRIGELSRRTGISERMLRYYELEGLISPRRSESKYREYSPEDVAIIEKIQTLTAAGIKIKTARALIPCMFGETPHFVGCPVVRAALAAELTSLEQRLQALRETRNAIEHFLAAAVHAEKPAAVTKTL